MRSRPVLPLARHRRGTTPSVASRVTREQRHEITCSRSTGSAEPGHQVSPAASVARVAAGRNAPSWRLDGNVLFQKPLSADRDAVDLIKNGFMALSIERRASSECEL